MINLIRDTKTPESLKNPLIQKYLLELNEFNVGKISEKPLQPFNYRTSDLLTTFDNSFHSKCYLTEKKYANAWAMDIEHFISKSEDEMKIFEWTNLLPCDHDANMVKGKSPIGGYLDPCVDNPEQELIQTILLAGKSDFRPFNIENIKAVNTSKLLNKIHNGLLGDNASEKKAENLQLLIQEKHDKIKDLILDWLDACKRGDKQREIQKETGLKLELSRKNSFTMLMRSSYTVKRYIPIEFLD